MAADFKMEAKKKVFFLKPTSFFSPKNFFQFTTEKKSKFKNARIIQNGRSLVLSFSSSAGPIIQSLILQIFKNS
jgi:hypothetical protein